LENEKKAEEKSHLKYTWTSQSL